MDEHLKHTINELKNQIDSLRPLDKDTENRIQQKFRLDWNYHSNNIEGNSLTFGETKSFLLHGITADGKPLKDHLDIKGHNEVLMLLQDVIKDERSLTENFIREIHQTILHEPYEKVAENTEGIKTKRRIYIGEYKTQPNHVKTQTGEIFYFATPEETPAKMNDLMDWYKDIIEKKSLHPAELAALFHYKFIRIHPFDDGNGRLARILMNLTLMKFGFPPVIIKTQKKDDYYRALQQADGGDENYFVDYIAKLQIDSLELYLRGAKGENIEEDDDVDKEITILKGKIQGKKYKEKRSKESVLETCTSSIFPLLTAVNYKLEKFGELFKNTIIFCELSGMPEQYDLSNDFSFQDCINYFIEAAENVTVLNIKLTYKFNDFFNKNFEQFSLQTYVNIEFGDYKYKISSPISDIFKGYNELLEKDIINEVSKTIAKNVLTKINEKNSPF